jgi:hypothetical protein
MATFDLSRCLSFALVSWVAVAGTAQAQSIGSDAIAPHALRIGALASPRLLPGANLSALALALALPPPAAEPQSAGAAAPGGPAERWVDARRVDRLESSLVELAHADSLVRSWGAVGALVLGGVLIAGGVLVGVADDGWGPRGRAAVSVAAWAAGASLIAAGVYRFFSRTPGEERLQRWSGLRQERKLDVFEFARIEGELASEAETARFGRRLAAYSSIGLVAGAAGLIGLAASSELDGSVETDAYVLGGVLAGVGAIQTVTLFLTRTPAEKAWQHYAEGGGGFFSQVSSAPHLAWR